MENSPGPRPGPVLPGLVALPVMIGGQDFKYPVAMVSEGGVDRSRRVPQSDPFHLVSKRLGRPPWYLSGRGYCVSDTWGQAGRGRQGTGNMYYN